MHAWFQAMVFDLTMNSGIPDAVIGRSVRIVPVKGDRVIKRMGEGSCHQKTKTPRSDGTAARGSLD
jgi:hypothetical protein